MQKHRKWTDKDLQYVLKHAGTVKPSHFHTFFDVSGFAFKKQVYEWRQKGHDIPRMRIMKAGVITTLSNGTMKIKTAAGTWRAYNPDSIRLPRRPKHYKKKVKAAPQPIQVAKPISNKEQAQAHRHGKQRREEARRLPNRIVDESQTMIVQIPQLRMTVRVKKGTNPQEVIDKYIMHRREEVYGARAAFM